jgi:hypothetical protein
MLSLTFLTLAYSSLAESDIFLPRHALTMLNGFFWSTAHSEHAKSVFLNTKHSGHAESNGVLATTHSGHAEADVLTTAHFTAAMPLLQSDVFYYNTFWSC